MAVQPPSTCRTDPRYHGVRLTADGFFDCEDDGYKYELVNGVMMMSPSPTPQHQAVLVEILTQISIFLRDHPVGHVLAETDVLLVRRDDGRDLVYRPEIIFLRSERMKSVGSRIEGPPDLVVEIVSPDSRRYDSETKKRDYEAHGVGEYWLIDPDKNEMTFYRRAGDRFESVEPDGDAFSSSAVPGFSLDVQRVRQSFKPW